MKIPLFKTLILALSLFKVNIVNHIKTRFTENARANTELCLDSKATLVWWVDCINADMKEVSSN